MLVLAGLLVMAVAAFWGLMASDALLPLGTGKHGWQLVKTKDGVLSATMPGTPTDQSSDEDIAGGRLRGDERVFVDANGDEYVLSCMASTRFEQQPAGKLLDNLTKLLMSSARLEAPVLTSERKLGGEGPPGRELVIESGGKLIQARAYVVKGRIYQAMATTGGGETRRKDARRFLDSVTIAEGD